MDIMVRYVEGIAILLDLICIYVDDVMEGSLVRSHLNLLNKYKQKLQSIGIIIIKGS